MTRLYDELKLHLFPSIVRFLVRLTDQVITNYILVELAKSEIHMLARVSSNYGEGSFVKEVENLWSR